MKGLHQSHRLNGAKVRRTRHHLMLTTFSFLFFLFFYFFRSSIRLAVCLIFCVAYNLISSFCHYEWQRAMCVLRRTMSHFVSWICCSYAVCLLLDIVDSDIEKCPGYVHLCSWQLVFCCAERKWKRYMCPASVFIQTLHLRSFDYKIKFKIWLGTESDKHSEH